MNIPHVLNSIDKRSLENLYREYCKYKPHYYFSEEWFVDTGMAIKQFLISEKDILSANSSLEQIDLLYNEYKTFEDVYLYGDMNTRYSGITYAERQQVLKIVTAFFCDNVNGVEYITDALNSDYHASWNGYVLLIKAYKIALKQAFDAVVALIDSQQKHLRRPPKRAVAKNSTVANKKERSKGGEETYGEQNKSKETI